MGVYDRIDSNRRRTWLLMFLMVVLVMALVYVIGQATNAPGAWVVGGGIFCLFMAWLSYYNSDKIALSISGARLVREEDDPKLYHLVENLCIASGLPLPRIYIIPDTAPNAFATGRDPVHASIAVTTGLLQKLERSELEGVLAHELSHVKNYDIRLQTIIVVMVGLVALISDIFLRFMWYGGGRRRGSGGGQLALIFAAVGIVLAILSPVIATLMQLAISRRREFLADADGALMTRYPEGLATALEKIAADPEPLEVANKATAHLYTVSPLKGKTGGSWLQRLWDTHPPIQARVAALREMM